MSMCSMVGLRDISQTRKTHWKHLYLATSYSRHEVSGNAGTSIVNIHESDRNRSGQSGVGTSAESIFE
ncbi:hypothetical protein HBI56_009480 [Parastagonospora nodorum]|uniref:Uncharacterized protein n=1 Tax=Phaeosphaeria nodorum (strain SN15 / ATCC MYA-4574 / FGSC 10173) TaxID=321614 RepID=A0A7U2EQ23_PHANO|nr:hypothetical protein HBH56_012250 [Parastagonospora nodorum]QRC90880.1 hypothetical protein JI435_400660 [Parastagonospora nodorum SN15]KAH3935273.1 hypothetical protein HBH54_045550 [Parastagonospora nodorum]KAH3950136.1 hypothetical protein HBH53_078180 [Parastagonospora nodorum]KAH3987210.1 hypothetical protein HBH51_011230 [Parastagonospora nodorum]